MKAIDLTGRERHLRAAMQAMSRIAARFARAGRRTLPFIVRRKSRLVPLGVSIVDGLGGAEQRLEPGVRMEVALEGKGGSAWGELGINAEGLAVILEGALGGSDSRGPTALGDEITPAQRALATRIARSLAEDLAVAVKEEVGIELELGGLRSVATGDPTEPRGADGLRVDCTFEGMPGTAFVSIIVSAEALEAAAHEQDEPPAQNGDPRVAHGLRDVEVDVVAELGRTTIGLRRVLALKVGEVLRLPTALDDSIDVLIAGVRKFHAVPVSSRGQVAIEIRGRHED
jgi:flagellar motor switch protein FliM